MRPIPRLTMYPDRETWLAARMGSLGGSDVPGVLGISRWSTPLTVWTSKVGLDDRDPSESTYSQRRGAHMEAFIAGELAADVGGLRIEKLYGASEYVMGHAPEGCLSYSPDALLIDPHGALCLGEWKSNLCAPAGTWEDDIPEEVRAQVQHGLYVLGLPAAYVAVDLGHEMRWKREERDPNYEALVVPALVRWWNAYVAPRTPPPPTGRDEDRRALDAMFPTSDPDQTVGLDVEFIDAARRLDEINGLLSALETEKAEIENRVRAAIGDAETGLLVDSTGWTWKKTRRVDPPRLEERVVEFKVLRRFTKPRKGDR